MNINPDLRAFLSRKVELPSAAPLLKWVGRDYPQGKCWNLVRDAYDEVGGVKLPDNYYAATAFFTQVHDARSLRAGGMIAPCVGIIGERDDEAVVPMPAGPIDVTPPTRCSHSDRGFLSPFVPQPWDVPMLSTIGGIRILPIHPGVSIDSERFLMTWGDVGAGIFRYDDERVSKFIAGFIRLINQ